MKVFDNNRNKGYYLITVSNKLSLDKRVKHITETLFTLAGIDLSYLNETLANVEISNTDVLTMSQAYKNGETLLTWLRPQ